MFELRQRVEPIRRTGMAGDEYKIAFARPLRAPFEKVLDLCGLAVLVDAKEAEIQTETRILEVVRVAAECGDAMLRGHDQSHVRVLLVAVQMIQPAMIECDDVAAQPSLLLRFLLNLRHA